MKRLSVVTLVFLAFSVFLVGSIAYAGSIDNRVAEMQRRINQGLKSGELTHQEALQLRQELKAIRNDEAQMRADGKLTKQDVDRFNGDLDRLSEKIYHEKHDRERENVVSDINRRVAEMQRRINQGVRWGELTRQEALQLRQELKAIRNDETQMRADGKLTKQELDRLNGELDRLSKNIYRDKHDWERRKK
jgi:septal ring factor EnvC (AmiA/AmiB activator)